MHELTLLSGVFRTVSREMERNRLSSVEEIALDVGELSSVVPEYLERCFPVAAAGTPLAKARLSISVVPAVCRCRACARAFPFRDTNGVCPACGGGGELVSGTDFTVRHIVAR
ncbi:MAG TPA: hydrogenase maturation nickel metallochaperone HypA [Clostridia bacterium]|nr:hydrogenase maturation nickel metallochaperone HypA [Clostridia bacterium]